MKLSIRVNAIEDRESETTLTLDCYTEQRERVTVYVPLKLASAEVDDVDPDSGEPTVKTINVFYPDGTYNVSAEHFVKGDQKFDKHGDVLMVDGKPDLCKGDGYRVMGVEPMIESQFDKLFSMFK